MPIIRWEKSLSVGNEKIDSEHRRLIKLINAIFRTSQREDKRKQFVYLLSMLKEYSVVHFLNEENYMIDIKYDGINCHKESHSVLRKKLSVLQRDIFYGKNVETKTVSRFLKDWIVGHVLSEDMKIRDFLYQKQKNVVDEGGNE